MMNFLFDRALKSFYLLTINTALALINWRWFNASVLNFFVY